MTRHKHHLMVKHNLKTITLWEKIMLTCYNILSVQMYKTLLTKLKYFMQDLITRILGASSKLHAEIVTLKTENEALKVQLATPVAPDLTDLTAAVTELEK